ncbi:MAG TPA: O-antigen ligase family protein [Solirubrobacterales bacterium]|nr:O-antigen ligase family protein [Solirubrobacterales bacterium]
MGLIAASAAAAVALVAGGRTRAVAMLVALALAPVVVAGDVWDTARFVDLRESPGHVAALAIAALAAIGIVASMLRRWPDALPVLAFAALAFRVPVDLGGDDANLLVPLYAVIAGGALAVSSEAWRKQGDDRAPVPTLSGEWLELAVRWLPWLLGGFLVLYAVQSAYSDDFSRAVENVCFFFVPFAVLFTLLVRARWTPRILVGVLAVAVGEALLFALVAFGQFAVGEVFWNPEVIAANEVHTYFRVNSLFWDPNILGRYLMLVMLALSAYMVWAREARRAWAAGGACAVLLVAIALTFSQSSLVALLAGLLALAAMRWGARWAIVGIAAAALAGGVLLAASGADLNSIKSLDIRSSGRASLVRGGLELAGDRPLAGYGSGSFQVEFQRRFPEDAVGTGAISHTEPVTVAAEQGIVGIAPYLLLLAAAVGALLAVPARIPVARSALVACFAGLVVHSLAYAGLLIDPVTWALVATGLALARHPVAAVSPAPARDRVQPTPPRPAPAAG